MLALELASGIVLGVALPWVAALIERSRFFAVSEPYEPLYAFSLGLLIYSIASLTHANVYLAAFAAGVTVASVSKKLRDEFHRFGETVAELFKLAALIVFGALISPAFLWEIPWSGYVFAFLALFLARPLALASRSWGASLRPENAPPRPGSARRVLPRSFTACFCSTRRFRSANEMFHIIALVIVGSMIAHSSTDVLIARWFSQEPEEARHRLDVHPRLRFRSSAATPP